MNTKTAFALRPGVDTYKGQQISWVGTSFSRTRIILADGSQVFVPWLSQIGQ
jgi:hypothetical protein